DPGKDEDTSTADDKVNVVTLEDREGIQSVEVTRETDVNTGIFTERGIGITIDKDGNASGTPSVGGNGIYSRGLTVTDSTGARTDLFPRNNEMETYVLGTNVGTPITKAVGETVTADEILAKVTVDSGNNATTIAHINDTADPKFRKVLAPGQTIPTTPGSHEVTVRVITDSNVYKDVIVTVNIIGTPTVTPNTNGSVTVTPSQTDEVTKKMDVTYTDETGTEKTVTATKGEDGNWSVPADSGVTVDPSTGAVTIPADSVQDGSTVKAVAKDSTNYTSAEATAQALNDPNTPTTGTNKKPLYVF
ncbi:TPA: hypothetical protein ACHVCJ_002117, partial [Streptococcus suis]